VLAGRRISSPKAPIPTICRRSAPRRLRAKQCLTNVEQARAEASTMLEVATRVRAADYHYERGQTAYGKAHLKRALASARRICRMKITGPAFRPRFARLERLDVQSAPRDLGQCPHGACRERGALAAPEDVSSVFGNAQTVTLATGYSRALFDAPVSATIVTRQEIEQSGVRTLAELLQTVTSYYVSSPDGGRTTNIVVRGLESRVLILVDNVPLLSGTREWAAGR